MAAGLAALALLTAACGGGAENGEAPDDGAANGAEAPSEALTEDVFTDVTAQGVECPSGTPGEGNPPLTFGSKNFEEQFTLGEMYSQALQSRGYDVTYQSNIGGTEVIDQAFDADQIDAYAEYLGVLESGPAGQEVGATPEETYQNSMEFVEAERAATLLLQTPFQNTDVVLTTSEFAQEHDLETVGDLNNVGEGGEGVTLAAQPPFETRFNGLVGMQEVYGLTNIAFTGVDPGLVYQLLDQGETNVSNGFSTDGQLASGDYTTLADPENIFGFQFVAPVVKQATLDEQGPEFSETLNCVSSLLTTEVMRALNLEVQINGLDPAVVAETFLTENGVLTE